MKREKIFENDSYMQPLILIKKDSSELLTNSSLSLIKGQVGSGKSRLVMNMMVGFSGVSDNLGLEYLECPEGKYVLYISTEMSKYHLQRRLLKVLKVAKKGFSERLAFFDFAYVPLEDKIKELKEACVEYPPYVIIIDQLGDFVSNINDIDKSMELIKQLMNGIEKYDCGIIGVIHQNEDSKDSSKARGHAGSLFEQKVVSSIAISDTPNGFKIQTTKLREGRRLTIGAEFDPETEMLKHSESDDSSLLSKVDFPSTASLLDEQLMALTGKGLTTVRSLRKRWLSKGLLTATKEGNSEIFNLKVD